MDTRQVLNLLPAIALGVLPCLASADDGGSMADMRRLIISGLGPGAAGATPGRSMVSVYGTVDVGVDFTRGPAGNRARVQGNNAWTSKLGVYGEEDLGDGWSAFFRLEAGLNPDTGTQQSSSAFFNRGSYVGISHRDWGSVSVGKQLSGASALAIGADPFLATGHQSIYSYLAAYRDLGYGSSVDSNRINDSISYSSPLIAKSVGFNLFYARKEAQGTGPGTHNRAVAVFYSDPKTFVSASYSQNWCDPIATSTTPCARDSVVEPTIRTDNLVVSGARDLGPLTGSAVFIRTMPKYAGDASANLYVLGVQKMMGRHLLRATAGYRDTSIPGNHAWGMTLGDDYYLSKRTSIYARLGGLKNGRASALTYNYEPTDAFPLPSLAGSVTGVTMGITYQF